MKHVRPYLIAALGLMALGAALPAMAQNDPRDQNINSLELVDSDIRDALKLLFKQVGVSYTVSQDVQGSVNASIQNKPFEVVLQNLLKQVDATYRVEGGIYNIVKREAFESPDVQPDPGAIPTTPTTRMYRLTIKHVDPLLIYDLLRGTMGIGTDPERSSMPAGGGAGLGGGGFGGGFGGGGMGGGGFGGGGMGGMGGGGFGGGGMGGGGFGGGFGGGGRGGGGGNSRGG